MLFKKVHTRLQKAELMSGFYKIIQRLENILPIPNAFVYFQIIAHHFAASGGDRMEQRNRNPDDMEQIDQKLADLFGILALAANRPVFIRIFQVNIQ